MNSNVAERFAQHREVLSILQTNYSGADDANRAIAVCNLKKETQQLCQQRVQDVTANVRGACWLNQLAGSVCMFEAGSWCAMQPAKVV